MANDFVTYVDDVTTGGSKWEVRETGHVVLARTQWLGQQDAPRKRRSLHRGSNVWAGAKIVVEEDNILAKWMRRSGRGDTTLLHPF